MWRKIVWTAVSGFVLGLAYEASRAYAAETGETIRRDMRKTRMEEAIEREYNRAISRRDSYKETGIEPYNKDTRVILAYESDEKNGHEHALLF